MTAKDALQSLFDAKRIVDLGEQEQAPEEIMWDELVETYRKLKAAKPDERSEKARRYAIVITEYEKMMSYYYTMIGVEFEG
ncbi:MAG: hypothetical protein KDE53_00645 [Caldilineaceae bacterium]|nr:hypothetical protein [Caldilineaceae bacterium]